MGLFDKLKKPKDPQRVKGAAMLFCPEPAPRKALDRVEELFHIDHRVRTLPVPMTRGRTGNTPKTSWRGWRDTSTKTRPGWWRLSATCFTTCASARA